MPSILRLQPTRRLVSRHFVSATGAGQVASEFFATPTSISARSSSVSTVRGVVSVAVSVGSTPKVAARTHVILTAESNIADRVASVPRTEVVLGTRVRVSGSHVAVGRSEQKLRSAIVAEARYLTHAEMIEALRVPTRLSVKNIVHSSLGLAVTSVGFVGVSAQTRSRLKAKITIQHRLARFAVSAKVHCSFDTMVRAGASSHTETRSRAVTRNPPPHLKLPVTVRIESAATLTAISGAATAAYLQGSRTEVRIA